MVCVVPLAQAWRRGDSMLTKVFAISTTQVRKNGKPITLTEGSVIELDSSIGDTYSKRACRVIEQNKTYSVPVEEYEEGEEVVEPNVIDLATANRSELFAFAEENGIALPAELQKKNVATEKLREGILNALRG